MGNFDRQDRGGNRGGFQSRGRSSFGGSRGGFESRGRSFDRGNDRGPREMFKAVCDNCGKDCEVPFRPTSGKPVYCSDCFEKMGGGDNPRSGRPERPQRSDFRPARPNFDQNKPQLDAINQKLDKILNLLEPKVKKEIFVAPIAEEVKVKKAKKVTPEK